MRQTFAMIALVVGGLLCFGGYCLILIDWVQDYRLGVFRKNWLEAVLETGALGLYTFLAIRFLKTKRLPL